MFLRFRLFRVIILALLCQSSTVFASPQADVPTLSQCKELVESISPSIVQLNHRGPDGQRIFGCGVIVSTEGHVVASGMIGAVLDNKQLNLRLSDGRQVAGEALGWSHEYHVGMFKITDPGEWSVIKLSEPIHPGEVCLSLGYSIESAAHSKDDRMETRLETRLRVVDRIAKGSWFTTPQHSQLTPHPVFNLNGELMGLATGDYSSSHAGELVMHLSASVIKQQWNELAAGIDLDKKRLIEESKPQVEGEKLHEKMSIETLGKIKESSVQIGEIGEAPSFSGVIVPGSLIVTCAHHHRLPGTEFNVLLANGKSLVASLLNSNWLTDISVLKVKSNEELPCVGFGNSGSLSPGDTVVTIGYPHRNHQKAIVLETTYSKFQRTNKFRDMVQDQLYSAGEDDEIEKGLSGVSGGGVFDSTGNLVGIHRGLVSNGAGWQLRSGRIELFLRNREDLVGISKVEAINADRIASVIESLTMLNSELKVESPKK